MKLPKLYMAETTDPNSYHNDRALADRLAHLEAQVAALENALIHLKKEWYTYYRDNLKKVMQT